MRCGTRDTTLGRRGPEGRRRPSHGRCAVLALVASCMVAPPGCSEGRDPQRAGAGVRGRSSAGDRDGPAGARGWFTDVSASAALDFRHDAGIDGTYFMPQILASGAAFLDHDGDGDLDVYLVNGAHWSSSGEPPPQNGLFRREPDGTYTDVTAACGLGGGGGFGMGVAVGDYDDDGDPDVYLCNYGPDALYRNEGDGTFSDVTAEAGVRNEAWCCSASFFDYDLDGDLDLFAANYVHYPSPQVCANDAGQPEYCGPSASPPTRDVLLRNEGDGTFSDVSDESGIGALAGRALGVLCEDLDDDGWIDVYVANDGEPNFLWLNNGDGTFTESAVAAGAAVNAYGSPEASMGVTSGDADGDGDPDLFMSHLVREHNTLYRNDGRGNFDDVTDTSGLGPASLAYTGFGAAFLDIDHDTDLDVVVVNGRVKRGPVLAGAEAAGPLKAYAEPDLLFVNDGGGRFEDASARAPDLCAVVEVSRGLAVADADDDGDLDLLISSCNGPARLLRNDVPARGHWLIVRALQGRRDAYGARVRVHAAGRVLLRTVNPAYSYASSSDPRAHFGLGDAAAYDAIEVAWPGGPAERFSGGPSDRVVTLRRGEGR